MIRLVLKERKFNKEIEIINKEFESYDEARIYLDDIKPEYEEIVNDERQRTFIAEINEEENDFESNIDYEVIESYYDRDIDNSGCDGRYARW